MARIDYTGSSRTRSSNAGPEVHLCISKTDAGAGPISNIRLLINAPLAQAKGLEGGQQVDVYLDKGPQGLTLELERCAPGDVQRFTRNLSYSKGKAGQPGDGVYLPLRGLLQGYNVDVPQSSFSKKLAWTDGEGLVFKVTLPEGFTVKEANN